MVFYSEKMQEDEEEKFRTYSWMMDERDFKGSYKEFKEEYEKEQEELIGQDKYDEMMYF